MFRFIYFILLRVALILQVGCEAEPSPAPVQSSHLESVPVSLTVKQRSSTAVPGSANKLQIAAGLLIPRTSITEGESIPFKLGSLNYQLQLKRLHNALVGDDFAEFEIADAVLTEQVKIAKLVGIVASLDGASFIRNGTEYTPEKAAKHLRSKLREAGDQIRTAEQFIEHIASKSSVSGHPYQLRLPDKSVVPAEIFLRDRLREIEKSSATPKSDRSATLPAVAPVANVVKPISVRQEGPTLIRTFELRPGEAFEMDTGVIEVRAICEGEIILNQNPGTEWKISAQPAEYHFGNLNYMKVTSVDRDTLSLRLELRTKTKKYPWEAYSF
jgi:hypothetical protein